MRNLNAAYVCLYELSSSPVRAFPKCAVSISNEESKISLIEVFLPSNACFEALGLLYHLPKCRLHGVLRLVVTLQACRLYPPTNNAAASAIGLVGSLTEPFPGKKRTMFNPNTQVPNPTQVNVRTDKGRVLRPW